MADSQGQCRKKREQSDWKVDEKWKNFVSNDWKNSRDYKRDPKVEHYGERKQKRKEKATILAQ